jgi:hypothetical protein
MTSILVDSNDSYVYIEIITLILVMSQGPDGPKGPTGISGRRGLQGDGRGPTGANLYSGGLLTVAETVESAEPSLTLVEANTGTYYSFLNTNPNDGSCAITLPSSDPANIGTFWVIKNLNTTYKLTLNFVSESGTAVYKGNNTSTTVDIAKGNSCILAYSGTSGNYIVF